MTETPLPNPVPSPSSWGEGEKPAVSNSRPALELHNVTKDDGQFRAVKDLSFSVSPGSICGFLGPNGAGKTTTIRMVLDIIKPSGGTITILGESSALKVRHRIGYLPEEKGLYKKMKAWSVIAYFATLKGLDRRTAKRRACELLERYGLKDFTNKPTDALSKGMQQKVQMLASIAHDPEFVILDEPFSGLDPINQQVMEEIIRDMATRNRTVLFSTHVMQHAERLCDRILLIARGRKIFDGTIAQARRSLPRRVRLETIDDISAVKNLAEVAAVRMLRNGHVSDGGGGPTTGKPGEESNGAKQWEVELRENADPQTILQACFESKVRLQSYNQSEASLHDVFVQLVGSDAKEASFR